jgi:hypothetical protein
MQLLKWASACVRQGLEINTMQIAQSLCARFLFLTVASLVSLLLVGCGGGQAVAPAAHTGIDFSDEQDRLSAENGKLLESYGSENLLRESAGGYDRGIVTPDDLSALLDSQNRAAAAQ